MLAADYLSNTPLHFLTKENRRDGVTPTSTSYCFIKYIKLRFELPPPADPTLYLRRPSPRDLNHGIGNDDKRSRDGGFTSDPRPRNSLRANPTRNLPEALILVVVGGTFHRASDCGSSVHFLFSGTRKVNVFVLLG